MRIAIVGRGENLYNCARLLVAQGHKIPLVITAKESPEYKRTCIDFEDLADEIGAQFIHSAKINSEKILNEIDKYGPYDLAVSINYSGIIGQEIIQKFNGCILNVHGGDLPKYRGNACQAWALINGENKIGLCVHKMIGGELDSGDIVARSYLDINIDSRIGEVYEWFESEIPRLVIESVARFDNDSDPELIVQSSNASDALRCYPRKPEDALIDWSKSRESILRLINASSEPYDGAFTTLNGKDRLIIWRAKLFDDSENYLAIPGQISQILDSGAVIVITPNGKLEINEISINGSRGIPNEYIKSLRTRMV